VWSCKPIKKEVTIEILHQNWADFKELKYLLAFFWQTNWLRNNTFTTKVKYEPLKIRL